MNRRSNSISGFVNFPVNDLDWKSTNEGGMLVKLVVLDDREFDDQFGECCGSNVYDILTECLIGDDQRPKQEIKTNSALTNDELDRSFNEEQAQRDSWTSFHYPHLNRDGDANQYVSRPYLMASVIGTTGWSGSNSEYDYWICKFDDLNDKGKTLYRLIQDLYPGCKLHLLTFLDT